MGKNGKFWETASRRIAAIDALGYVTTTAYDNANRATSVTDPLGNTTQTVYDPASRERNRASRYT